MLLLVSDPAVTETAEKPIGPSTTARSVRDERSPSMGPAEHVRDH
jgi:hypothetical protein